VASLYVGWKRPTSRELSRTKHNQDVQQPGQSVFATRNSPYFPSCPPSHLLLCTFTQGDNNLLCLSVTIICSCSISKLSETNSYKIEDLFSIPKAARALVITELMVRLYRGGDGGLLLPERYQWTGDE
jgi:hypothetical protein